MNSCSVSDFHWFWFLIFTNVLCFLLWKFSPERVFNLFTLFIGKLRKFGRQTKQVGRPMLHDYWKKYYHIKDMLVNNINWGASRIHSELLLLGYDISLSSVKRIIRKIEQWNKPLRGSWNVWLNLISQIKDYTLAMDLCHIQTIYGKTLYALAFIHELSNLASYGSRD